MRQGEDDVAVGHREQLLGLRREPLVASHGLALGTTARTTRVIGDDLLLTGIALLEVGAESGRAACADVTALLGGQFTSPPSHELLFVLTKDIGDFEPMLCH
jgi:hypothetical protein